MIWASAPWKTKLLKDAEIVYRWATKPTCSERKTTLLEQKVFLAAYSIRKLIDSNKVATSWRTKNIPCLVHPTIDPEFTPWSLSDLERHLDLAMDKRSTITEPNLANEIIHSAVFCLGVQEDWTVLSFYVASDQRKRTRLQGNRIRDLLIGLGSILLGPSIRFRWGGRNGTVSGMLCGT